MAKFNLCDICLADGKLSIGRYRTGIKHADKADICEAHKGYFRSFTTAPAFLAELHRLTDLAIKAGFWA